MAQNPLPNTENYHRMMQSIYENIEKFDIEKHLNEFNQIIRENKYYKLNILDLIEKMQHFHRFTPESLEHMIGVINKNPNTFTGYGPYVKTEGYWKSMQKSKNNDAVSAYIRKIEEQQKYIEQLEKKLNAMNKLTK